MKSNPNKGNGMLLLLVAVMIVVVVTYLYYMKSPSTDNALLSSSAGAVGAISKEDQEFLSLLTKAQGIKIKEDFFKSSVFMNLQNFNVDIAKQPQGRPDPFAPLGYQGFGAVVPNLQQTVFSQGRQGF